MASISRGGNSFQRIQQAEEAKRVGIADGFNSVVGGDLKTRTISAAAAAMKPGAGKLLKGYAKIFEAIDAPIATAMEALLKAIGIAPQVFQGAQLLLESDSIGLDPHEKLGIPAWKYGYIVEIDDFMKELSELEQTGTFSAKIDRKKAIEEQIRARLREISK